MKLQSPLANYLDYYKNLTNPGFAALVTGDWGSGKTYQVKKALQPEEYHYVSLFGLASEADVYGAVFAKMSPEGARSKSLAKWLENKNVGAGGINIPVGSLIGAAINALVRDEIDVSKILIFDDLERSPLDSKVLLGIMNTYVEHHGCRVIAIAHDDKMIGDFAHAKEKLFGQTIRVIPQLDDAFSAFENELGLGARNVIERHRSLLKEVFKASKCNSLRVLRHVLMDIQRFISCLEVVQLEHEAAMSEILGFLAAMSIELRSGQLNSADIKNRMMSYVSYQMKPENRGKKPEELANLPDLPPIVRSYKKFSELVKIIEPTISDEILEATLVNGEYDKAAIQKQIRELAVYQDNSNKPLWWKFWQYRTTPAADVRKTMCAIDDGLAEFSFVELGDVLHIFAIQFFRIEYGFEKWSPNDVLEKAKKYLVGLVERGQFPMSLPSYIETGFMAYGGYGISFPEKYYTHRNEILNQIEQCQKLTWQRSGDVFKKNILNLLNTDVDSLNSLLNHYLDGKNDYYEIPALVSISPRDFVEELIKTDIKYWKYLGATFAARKERARHTESIKAELDWFREVDLLLLEAIKSEADPIKKMQILSTRPITDSEFEAERRAKSENDSISNLALNAENLGL